MRKRTRNIVAASAAVLAAALIAFPAAFALVPGSVSRYIDEDHYTGEVVTDTTEGSDHGGHEDWIDLNAAVGTSTSYTISTDGKYYLSDDLEAHLSVGPSSNNTEENKMVVDLCLNGHVLDGGNRIGSTINVGDTSNSAKSSRYCVMNLYDCGGGESVHYYKLRDDGVSYDFSDETIDPDDPDTYDGYVRGGLITGGNGDSDAGIGGGITIKENSQYGGDVILNMYGGTIAGNHSSNGGGGIAVKSGKLNMYGGSVEGNQSSGGVPTADRNDYGGAGVCVDAEDATAVKGDATFRMYGGTIRNNYSGGWGGGVEVNGVSTTYGAVFEMYGGVIEGNRARYGGGVGMYDYYNTSSSAHATDTFRMYGGTIRGNTSVYGGGGIYMYSSGSEIEISGGTITGNVQEEIESGVSNRGGGIDFFNEDTIALSGTAYVYGNYCAGQICNIGISEGHLLTFGEDGLADGAKIGVTCVSGQTQITTNYFDGAEAYFISDDRTFRVTANGSSYLQLTSKK